MRKAAIALGIAGLAAAATTLSLARAPGAAVAYAGWVTEADDCSPGKNAGQAVERVSKVTVDGKALVEGLEPLKQGDRIKTSRRGKALICLKRGGWECDIASDTTLRVIPRAQVVIELADGRATCSTPNVEEQRLRAPGSVLLVGRRMPSLYLDGGNAVESGGGQVLSIGFVNGRTIVKVRRGLSVLASKQTVKSAVVLGRGQQAAVQPGRKPSAPTSLTLTQSERATFAERERSLPKESDRTSPKVTLGGPHDPSSVRSAQFSFSAGEAATFSCALDNTDFRLCTSPFGINRVDRGRHTFYVRATDVAGNTGLARFSWTVDGSRVAFESFRDGNPEIYTVDPDGENLVRVTTNTISDEHPDWSPGQARIAFDRLEGKVPNLDIYTMNADGSGLQRLTQDPARDRNPSWSPDGTKIAFESYRDGGNRDIYVMNADGSGQRRLTTDPAEDLDPAWAPDGRQLVFASTRDGNFEIYIMNADGSGQTRLTNDPAPEFGPSWAPSTRIAFHSLRTRDYQNIFVMNPDGTDVRQVTRTERNDTNPAWAPDAVNIVFQSDRDPGAEDQLYVVDVETGVVTRMPMASARANFVPDW